MKSLNEVKLIGEYQNGASLTDLSAKYGVSASTARRHVLKAGALRSRTDGIRLAAKAG
jgi:DeoR/GlpR family transcriptional regulator of sugar metabolism